MIEKLKQLENIILNSDRREIKKPILEDGYIVMTNGHILCMIITNLAHPNDDFLPSFQSLRDICKDARKRKSPKEKEISFRPYDWMKLISNDLLENSKKKIDCEECEGEGGEDCSECDNYKECQYCNGEGYKMVTDPSGRKILPSLKYIFEINDKHIDAALIYKMLESINIIDPSNDQICIYTKQYDHKTRVVGKDFIFVLMPLNKSDKAITLLKIGSENYD